MNYFELFDIPVSFIVDQEKLSSQYIALQKKYPVDFFAAAGKDRHSEVSGESAMIDEGFKILKDPDDTMEYVLQMKGLLPAGENYELPPDFLIEMTELTEGLKDSDILNIEEAKTKIFQLQKSLYHGIQHIVEGCSDDTITEGQLLQVKDYFYKKKYLDGILDRLHGMRNIAT